ncbi:MAG TPA: TCP-1/cpn60 chaperonin family protein, partial [Acidobacteriota bacterium]|nr:TCP-1/cpn60 chaperonin family protein [Acidobacteriota bacterium]
GCEGAIVCEKVKASKESNYGYNADSDTYEDLVAAGVIDPAKVARTALQNASSIASLLLTTEATVHELPEPEKPMPGGPGGMPPGGMY